MRTRSDSNSAACGSTWRSKLTRLRGRRYTLGVVPSVNPEPVTEQPIAGLDVRETGFALQLHAVDGVEGGMALHLSGRIGPDNVDLFRNRTGAAMEAGYSRLMLDCAGLHTLSGTAIGAFAALQRALRLRGGDLVVVELPEPARELFRLLGFADLITVAPELEEAVSHLASPDQTPPPVLFPHVLECPACTTRLRAVKSGRFRCSSCQAVLAINNGAQVFTA